MGKLIFTKPCDENDLHIEPAEEEVASAACMAHDSYSHAMVPTIDIYTAKVLFQLTQKIVEDTVDKRVSALEEKITNRDREIMRAIRKIQASTIVSQKKSGLSWWRKLFTRDKQTVQ